MSDIPTVDAVKTEVDRLASLLGANEQGLFSWWMVIGQQGTVVRDMLLKVLPVERKSDPSLGDVICKGDWTLGTACGRCIRCRVRVRRLLELYEHVVKSHEGAVTSGSPPLTTVGIDWRAVERAGPNAGGNY